MNASIFAVFAVLAVLTWIVYQACVKIQRITSAAQQRQAEFDSYSRIFEEGNEKLTHLQSEFFSLAAGRALDNEAQKALWKPALDFSREAALHLLRRDYFQVVIRMNKAHQAAQQAIGQVSA